MSKMADDAAIEHHEQEKILSIFQAVLDNQEAIRGLAGALESVWRILEKQLLIDKDLREHVHKVGGG